MEKTILQLFNTAKSLHQQGKLEQAETVYRKILIRDPHHADAYHLLGCIAYQTGHPEEAVQLIKAAIQETDKEATFYINLGHIHADYGRKNKALDAWFKALNLNPDNTKLLNRIETLGPEKPEHFFLLANKYFAVKNFNKAVVGYQKAISLRKDYTEAYTNLGVCLEKSGKLDLAKEKYQWVLRMNPDSVAASFNLANVLENQGDLEGAKSLYNRVISLKPDHADARFSLSNIQLLEGDLDQGFKHYDWRMKMGEWKQKYPSFVFDKPQWQGETFQGKTLLVHDEQGFGDVLMFIRYLPMVKALGGQIVFVTREPLIPLLKKFPGIDRIVPRSDRHRPDDLPAFDLYVFLLSLPRIFKTTLDTIPCKVPYLYAKETEINKWQKIIPQNAFAKVGLVWAGQPKHLNDRNRSIPLTSFLPLITCPNLNFLGLQKGERSKEAMGLPQKTGFINMGEKLENFADTANLISQLELVITVDTSVAHLAGAMGKDTWVLLPLNNDWRWLKNKNETPWYPNIRLFRQKEHSQWGSVIERVSYELHKKFR